ncbi:type III secretion system chaperone [Comamonas endophytica]|uniref:Type III secretion system chaperone n=1 Tax=Comamonas endophytica TaxID=2949090 RepID=A0ABY6G5X8_9BURK|nr:MULTISPECIES: type III secretion system chaperone [unclassified Acidovorax]MCD2512392.1 type III secretion system chaperone [Acidovorax sp. D4N7]UYG50160.1 type III secretion system chaperone [Acidovorax sp. 5MLIR]
MDIYEQASALLLGLGSTLGIALALDADGACGLRVDDRLELTLRLEPRQQALLAYAQVHALPETGAESVLLHLMAANHVWEESQGATWSLHGGQLTLARLLPLRDLDAGQLAQELARFADVALGEQQRLQSLAGPPAYGQGLPVFAMLAA